MVRIQLKYDKYHENLHIIRLRFVSANTNTNRTRAANRGGQVRSTNAMESGLPADVNFKQLLAKYPQEIGAEYDLLNVCLKLIPSTDVALMPQNRSKNRYINTLPCKNHPQKIEIHYRRLLFIIIFWYYRRF